MAYPTNSGAWAMFGFGFAGIFVEYAFVFILALLITEVARLVARQQAGARPEVSR